MFCAVTSLSSVGVRSYFGRTYVPTFPRSESKKGEKPRDLACYLLDSHFFFDLLLALKMEAINLSETLITFYRMTRNYIQEDGVAASNQTRSIYITNNTVVKVKGKAIPLTGRGGP
jgi:hypothetical protein